MGINNKMLKLTNETFDDNATVRVVTVVTLIYLPASFVSVSMAAASWTARLTRGQTVLGMNLFSFHDGKGTQNFTISKQFWIFVVLAVPLTLLTLGSWFIFTRRRVLRRKLQRSDDQIEEKSLIGLEKV